MAKTLHCPVCNMVTGHIGDDFVGEIPTETHCSVHHPNPAHRIEDKPTVRMTVRVVEE